MNETTTTDRRAACNSGFAKKRVQWLIEHSTSHQILWYVDSLVLRNPLLRKAANRYRAFVEQLVNKKFMKNLTIYLILILINFAFTNFKNVKVKSYPIMENEIIIKNRNFQDLIFNSRKKFIKKFKYQPKVITVRLHENKENVKIVEIFNCAFLNIKEKDKEIFDRKYIGATSIDSTLVLIVDKPIFSSSLFEVKSSKKDFYVFDENKLDFCEQEFIFEISDVFRLKKTLWSYELKTK